MESKFHIALDPPWLRRRLLIHTRPTRGALKKFLDRELLLPQFHFPFDLALGEEFHTVPLDELVGQIRNRPWRLALIPEGRHDELPQSFIDAADRLDRPIPVAVLDQAIDRRLSGHTIPSHVRTDSGFCRRVLRDSHNGREERLR